MSVESMKHRNLARIAANRVQRSATAWGAISSLVFVGFNYALYPNVHWVWNLVYMGAAIWLFPFLLYIITHVRVHRYVRNNPKEIKSKLLGGSNQAKLTLPK